MVGGSAGTSEGVMSSSKFDSCYLLTNGANGVKAKFIGAPIVGPKKKTIWIQKTLVTVNVSPLIAYHRGT